MTGPIQRLCRLLASEGYIAVSPEVYHEFETPGHILKYDAEGTDKGNKYKVRPPPAPPLPNPHTPTSRDACC